MDYLRGEIPVGTQLILSTWINKVAYFLSYSASEQELVFVTNPTSSNIVVATMSSFGPNAVSLKINNPTGLDTWIGATNVSGSYWANLTDQQGLSYTNNQFQPWAFPLTGVTYSFQQAGFTLNWRVTLESTTGMPVNERLTSGIRVVPLEVFPLGSCTQTTLTTAEVIKNEQDAANSEKVQEYFTTSGDCSDGFFYMYCPTGTDCGTTCKSPCLLANEVCTFDGTNNTFSCVNIKPGGSDLTPLAIAIAILVIIIIIGLIWFGLLQIDSSNPYYQLTI